MHSRATYFPSFLRFSLFCTHLFIIASYLVLMRDKGKKSIRRYLELRTRYSIFFLPSFSYFPGHRSSRLTPVTCNQIQGNSKMGKGGDRKREYRSEQWAANWQLSRRHWESLYRPDYRSRRLLFFFFFIGSFTVKRRLFVSRHAEDVSLFRLFLPVIEPRLWEHLPSKHPDRKGFSATDIFAI